MAISDDTDEVVAQGAAKGLNLKPKSSIDDWLKLSVVVVLFLAVVYGAVQYGKHSERKVTWMSELLEKTRGQKAYFMDFEITCQNGKDLGRFQADLNLTNGIVKIVRNDPKNLPDCSK